eukprot:TRINITY_DN895_c0_g1_i38.p1 TRINITY_DN895_c0_g1~~TRINITY_DN895_c0_g1_i38.p1  ORF type:complete len:137 (+),score=33.28 TRINITY_DN895_c0_g1_i38:51-413(+)
MTYNLQSGEGMDGKYDLGRSGAVVANVKPDLVSLQEVSECCDLDCHEKPVVEERKNVHQSGEFSFISKIPQQWTFHHFILQSSWERWYNYNQDFSRKQLNLGVIMATLFSLVFPCLKKKC